MKLLTTAPILLLVLGVIALFSGSAIADAEEGAANSIGGILQNKWVAIGLIVGGGLWFASSEGYLSRG